MSSSLAVVAARRRSRPRCRCWPGRRRSGRWSGGRRCRGRRRSASGLSRVCTSRIALRPLRSGGETKIWRSKRPGRSSAGSSFSSRFEAAITTISSRAAKPSSSTSSWLSVWSFSPEMSLPRVAPTASSSSMKMIAGRLLARLAEQPPDAGGAEAGEHLDERGGRLGEEGGVRLVRHRLGQQRLAGARAGRAAGCPAARARPAPRKRLGSRRNSTTSRSSSLASSTPATSSQLHRAGRGGLDLLRLGARHEAQHPDEAERDDAEEDDRQPDHRPVLDVAPGSGRRRCRPAGRSGATLKVSLPSSRAKVWLASVDAPVGGQRPARRGQQLAGTHARAWSQVRSPVSWTRDAVAALRRA